MEEVNCGIDNCESGTLETQACMPIFIPENDPAFGEERCLEFVRTLPVPDANNCTMGPRQQLNQVTAYLDGSLIYANTDSEAFFLRDFTDPSMRMTFQSNNKLTQYGVQVN